MTFLITIVTKERIIMASDSRGKWYHDVRNEQGIVVGESIKAIFDCMYKTLWLKHHKVGIQSIGLGLWPKGNEEYQISEMIEEFRTTLNEKDDVATIPQKLLDFFIRKKQQEGLVNLYYNIKLTIAGYKNAIPHVYLAVHV